jgi:hypothetical protein
MHLGVCLVVRFDTRLCPLYLPTASHIILQATLHGSPNMVFINVSPIEYGHVLLVPRVMDCLPQVCSWHRQDVACSFCNLMLSAFFLGSASAAQHVPPPIRRVLLMALWAHGLLWATVQHRLHCVSGRRLKL